MSIFSAREELGERGDGAADALRDDAEVDLLAHPPLDEPCVTLYVKHLLGWIAENPGAAGPIVIRPAEPLPNVGIGTKVVLDRYRDRITYGRVVYCLKAACHLENAPNDTQRIGTIDGRVHHSPCAFRITFSPRDVGVVIEHVC